LHIKKRYIVHIQFLGFRFHGWAKQTGFLTVHEMVDKTTRFVLGHEQFKTIGCSRTDAKVSALHFAFELITQDTVETDELLRLYNKNFPQDIRVIKVEIPHSTFNIIQSPVLKEYVYLFAYGSKDHPFTAPYLVTFPGTLDIELMKKGAALFEGEHNFRKYCTQPSPQTRVVRKIRSSKIEENQLISTGFFPEKTYAFSISAKGFMRNQVRLMMAQLVRLGNGNINLQDLEQSMTDNTTGTFNEIAPASGLLLKEIRFKELD